MCDKQDTILYEVVRETLQRMQYQNEDDIYHLDTDSGGGGIYLPGVGVESVLGRRLGVENGLGRRNNLAKSLR